ncbi:MAG: hypothetical protein JNM57_14620 [Cyclobacteriaceae bacterium]|nr:hypothetical protein [Cyclobacteriaceae bacterium]
MTWKYPGQLAKRFVAPVPSVQRKLLEEFHTSISSRPPDDNRNCSINSGCFSLLESLIMEKRFSVQEVIAGSVHQVFLSILEKLIKNTDFKICKNYDELGISDAHTDYVLISESTKVLVLIHFNLAKEDADTRLMQFLNFDNPVIGKSSYKIVKLAIGIGLWGLDATRALRKHRTRFSMHSPHNLVGSLEIFNIQIDDDLTMDIDNYILYQKLSAKEQRELVAIILHGTRGFIQNSLKSSVDEL